jgi:hypothetical protein
MIIPPLPQTLVPAMAFIAWFVANWLHHSPLKPWANALIALAVPFFVALIWAAFSGGFTQNVWGDIGLIVVLSYAALALPELAPWRQWLQDALASPFALWDAPTAVDATITATTPPMTPYSTPTGLDLRSSALPSSQFATPSPTLHSRPTTMPPALSQNTAPMETPARSTHSAVNPLGLSASAHSQRETQR